MSITDAIKGRALVIEDQPTDLAVVREVLEGLGYEVLALEDPIRQSPEAWNTQARLVMVCADVKNGFNLCLKIKKHPFWKRVPLILTTGKASPEVIRKHRMLPTRADAYLFKPLDREALAQAVREMLPEDFQGTVSERDVEVPVGMVAERTLVSPGQLENAVVTYVEDEVRNLRTTLERLITEKSASGPIPLPAMDLSEFQVRLEEARALARQQAEAAFAIERERLRTEVLQQQALATESESRAASLRRELDEARKRLVQAEADRENLARELTEMQRRLAEAEAGQEALRAELDQTTLLFERLESGYKDAQAKAEAEREAAMEEVARLEARMEEIRTEVEAEWREPLNEARSALAESEKEVERLRRDLQTMKKRLEAATAAGARVAELEAEMDHLAQQLETARQGIEEAAALRQAAAEARQEAEVLRDRLRRVREIVEETP